MTATIHARRDSGTTSTFTDETWPAPRATEAVAPTSTTKPERWEMASAIADEGATTVDVANRIIDFLAKKVAPTGSHHLKDDELTQIHPVLEKIMPDDTRARPGSAHDLLDRGLLEGKTFVHTKIKGRQVEYCAVLTEAIPV